MSSNTNSAEQAQKYLGDKYRVSASFIAEFIKVKPKYEVVEVVEIRKATEAEKAFLTKYYLEKYTLTLANFEYVCKIKVSGVDDRAMAPFTAKWLYPDSVIAWFLITEDNIQQMLPYDDSYSYQENFSGDYSTIKRTFYVHIPTIRTLDVEKLLSAEYYYRTHVYTAKDVQKFTTWFQQQKEAYLQLSNYITSLEGWLKHIYLADCDRCKASNVRVGSWGKETLCINCHNKEDRNRESTFKHEYR